MFLLMRSRSPPSPTYRLLLRKPLAPEMARPFHLCSKARAHLGKFSSPPAGQPLSTSPHGGIFQAQPNLAIA
jgi:hypothetical protein